MPAPHEPDQALVAASRRAWRIALVAYLVPLTVATHWPRLGFGQGGTIDKFIHFAGFGLLAWMWMHAAPLGRAWLGFVVGFAWVYLDERTQALEVLGRTFSFHDMLAGWIGVAMAGLAFAFRHAAPRGSAERAEMLEREAALYARGASWRDAAVRVLLCVVAIGGGMIGSMRLSGVEVHVASFIYATGFAGLFGLILATALGLRRMPAQRTSARPHGAPASWAWPLSLALGAVLFLAYSGLVRAMFGSAPAEGVAFADSDHEGFVILEQGFAVMAVLAGILISDRIAWRRASAPQGGMA